MPQLSEKMLEIHKATDAPLDHTVPPDFHPGQLTNIGRELEAAGGSLEPYEAARRAFAAMYSTASDANAAVASAMRPCPPFIPTPGAPPLHAKIPDADCEQISSLIYSRVATASRAVDAVGAQLDDVVASLGDAIARTLKHKDDGRAGFVQNQAEIRAHVKAITPPSSRFEFVVTAIDEGELDVASAILSGSNWTSGLGKKEFALLKDTAERRFGGKLYAQREAVRKLRAQLDSGGSSFVSKIISITPQVKETASQKAMKRLKGAA